MRYWIVYLVCLLALIKIVFNYFAYRLKRLLFLAYTIIMLMGPLTFFGLYYYFDNRLVFRFDDKSAYVLLFSCQALLASAILLATQFIPIANPKLKTMIVFLTLVASMTLLNVLLAILWEEKQIIGIHKWVYINFLSTLVNGYLALDLYYIQNYRIEKIDSMDYPLILYFLCTDIIFGFWIDLKNSLIRKSCPYKKRSNKTSRMSKVLAEQIAEEIDQIDTGAPRNTMTVY